MESKFVCREHDSRIDMSFSFNHLKAGTYSKSNQYVSSGTMPSGGYVHLWLHVHTT
jgi:hypothetical protein